METNVPEKDVAELDAKHLEEELNKSVGVAVDYKTVTRNNLFKFLIFSAIGVWVFFIPTTIGGNSGVPMVLLIDAVKALLGPTVMNWMVLILCIALSITFTISRIQKDGPIRRFHKKDGWGTGILYYLSAIFAVMVVFNVGPSQIVNDSVGIEAIGLAGSTLLTVTIAGWLVNFLIEFGILEFIGTLMEPIMRKVFKLPGQSAVTAVSAFVAAPAVGVFMTDRLYHENVYTHKEACCVATNFSVVSLGFFALLVTITDTQYMYGNVTNVYGLPCVVAINAFPTDTEAELKMVEEKCKEKGVNVRLSEVWAKGGEGGKTLAEEVIRLCEEEKSDRFQFVYDLDTTIEEKLNAIATKVYRADGVVITAAAKKQIQQLTELGFDKMPICMAKTQFSFSDDASKLGAPRGFKITVREVKVNAGAGFLVAKTGDIMTMPGLPKVPSAEKIDIDDNGVISGLF